MEKDSRLALQLLAALLLLPAWQASPADTCSWSLPIETAAMAICRVQHLGGTEPLAPARQATWSAERTGKRWRVSIAPSQAIDIGGGYVVDIDAQTGEVVKPGVDR